jgi:hypothetical protein
MDLSGSGSVKFTEKYSLPRTQDQSIIFYGDQFRRAEKRRFDMGR